MEMQGNRQLKVQQQQAWDALNNPEEAATIQVKYLKALNPEIIVDELKILKRIAITPDVQQGGYGAINMAKMKRTVDFINNIADGSTEPAKRFYKYARPWRWSSSVVVVPALMPARSSTPTMPR